MDNSVCAIRGSQLQSIEWTLIFQIAGDMVEFLLSISRIDIRRLEDHHG